MSNFTFVSCGSFNLRENSLHYGEYCRVIWPKYGRGFIVGPEEDDDRHYADDENPRAGFLCFHRDAVDEYSHNLDGNRPYMMCDFFDNEAGWERDGLSWVVPASFLRGHNSTEPPYVNDAYNDALFDCRGLTVEDTLPKNGYIDVTITSSNGTKVRGILVHFSTNTYFFTISNVLRGMSISGDIAEGIKRYLGAVCPRDIELDGYVMFDQRTIGDFLNCVMENNRYVSEVTLGWGDGSSDAPTVVPDVMSDLYESNTIYEGQNDYHTSHDEDWYMNESLAPSAYPFKMGVELEVECLNNLAYSRAKKIKSNVFYKEEDGSLGSRGIEFISVPLRVEDATSAAFWRPLCETLSTLAASKNKSTTGLHIHIGRAVLGETSEEMDETIFKLFPFYMSDVKNNPFNVGIYGRESTYGDTAFDMGSKMAAAKELGLKEVMAIDSLKDTIKKDVLRKTTSTRYMDINNTNEETIEFRKGKGSICPERIAAVCAYSLYLTEYVRDTDEPTIDGLIEYVRSRATPENGLVYFCPLKEF